MPIRILPREVSEKIAAGEVIQRPASVVRELLDNSIDAGAGRISIEVERAGLSMIRVTDDGSGIPAQELPLVFEHHATSKIESASDLFNISTMGFRGEAMPSIASVSEVAMISRPASSRLGARIEVAFGTVARVAETGAPVGTTVEVRNLFANFPVRVKFLKSPRTEWGCIDSAVTHAAIAFPKIAFRLSRDGKDAMRLEGHADAASRIGAIFGKSAGEEFLKAESGLGRTRVECLVCPPRETRSSMSMVHVYVNRRHVRVPAATKALMTAFGEYIPRGRYPVAFVFITVPPETLDVNVHPAKEEVKFRDAGSIHDAVEEAVSNALRRFTPTPDAGSLPGRGTVRRPDAPPADHGEAGAAERRESDHAPRFREFQGGTSSAGEPAGWNRHRNTIRVGDADVPWNEGVSPRFMQVHDSFILAEEEGGILLIDQHALHERILLDELQERMRTKTVEKQRLLLPLTVSLSPEESSRMEEMQELLKEVGIDVERGKHNSLVIHSVPAAMKRVDPADLVLELISGARPGLDRDSRLREILGQMACRAAVKAGDRLSREEIEELLRKIKTLNPAKACAHGRPTHFLLTLSQIEKMFERK